MKRVLISLVIIGTIGASSFLLTNSYFSDTETSSNNTFTAGKLDLKINGVDNPTAVVSFNDLKPGDVKVFDKTLLVDDNPAWVFMHLKDLTDAQGTQTEPEIAAENGTPQSDIQNYLTYTLTFPDPASLISNLPLPDAVSCWIPLGQIPGGQTTPMKQTFSFDPAVGNWAQGDTLSFTEEFYAVQTRNNPNPLPPPSTTGRIWDEKSKKCVYSDQLLSVETVTVPANLYTPTSSVASLTTGKHYLLEASGVWTNSLNIADAEYTSEDAWVTHHDGYNITPYFLGFNEFDLQVNGNFIDWGAYNGSHTYTSTITGSGSPVNFMIFDGDSTIPAINQSWYGDNSGNLTVKIYELP